MARVRACKADALDAANFGDLRQKRGEVFGGGLVGVYRLAEQHHFGNALVGGSADFGENVVCFAVFLGTAEVRHDAVAAALVATALDRDECAEVVAQLGVVAKVVFAAVFVDEHLVVRLVQRAVGVAEQKFRFTMAVSSAFSRTLQVFTMMMSASSWLFVSTQPHMSSC